MRLLKKLILASLSMAILAAAPALAEGKLQVKRTSCESTGSHTALCTIETEGTVKAGDRLVMKDVYDIDTLFYDGEALYRTGRLFGFEFYARWVPRVYPLEKLAGKRSPTFRLDTKSLLGPGAGFFEKTSVEIVSEDAPIFPHLKSFLYKILQFLFFMGVLGYGHVWFFHRQRDGWIWNEKANQLFFLSCVLLNLSLSEVPRMLVPSLISGERYFFGQAVLAALFTWSVAVLVASASFRDPSSLEKFKNRYSVWDNHLRVFNHVSLVAALLILSLRVGGGFKASQALSLLVQSSALAASILFKAARFDWRRIWKRSRFLSNAYVHCLFAVGIFAVVSSLRYYFLRDSDPSALVLASSVTLGVGILRMELYRRVEKQSQAFVEEVRAALQKIPEAEQKLETLCLMLQEEWNAARVSIISVKGDQGLLLASVGPDAIDGSQAKEPRKLGPFMKRVIREKHMLFAPVAEELGHDLVEHGLKHSSLAIPVLCGDTVDAVLCLMAQEDERISPESALVLELAASGLTLEIDLAVSHAIAEEKARQLSNITVLASGIVMENLDSWGRLPEISAITRRMVVSADCAGSTVVSEHAADSPMVAQALQSFKLELYAHWFGLRSVFEFISKDVRGDDFWALSPKEFKNPLLRMIGEEKAAVLLAYLLDKTARQLARSDEYRLLGLHGARVSVGAAHMRLLTLGLADSKCLDIDSPQLSQLARLRGEAEPGKVFVDAGDPGVRESLQEEKAFLIRDAEISFTKRNILKGLQRLPEIRSLVGVSIDKKEFRKLEMAALELARENIKKSAA